jgi:hypothetical protein
MRAAASQDSEGEEHYFLVVGKEHSTLKGHPAALVHKKARRIPVIR